MPASATGRNPPGIRAIDAAARLAEDLNVGKEKLCFAQRE